MQKSHQGEARKTNPSDGTDDELRLRVKRESELSVQCPGLGGPQQDHSLAEQPWSCIRDTLT